MTSLFAILLAAVLALISALHVYWALGGQWASTALVPTLPNGADPETPDGRLSFNPGPFAMVAVAVLLVVAAMVALGAAGTVTLPVPQVWVRFSIWALAVVLFLRAVGDFRYVGLTKRVRETPFARLDTTLYTPLCLALSALALGVALGSR